MRTCIRMPSLRYIPEKRAMMRAWIIETISSGCTSEKKWCVACAPLAIIWSPQFLMDVPTSDIQDQTACPNPMSPTALPPMRPVSRKFCCRAVSRRSSNILACNVLYKLVSSITQVCVASSRCRRTTTLFSALYEKVSVQNFIPKARGVSLIKISRQVGKARISLLRPE